MSEVGGEEAILFDPCANDIERKAMRFARGWHRYPALNDALSCEGVHIGETVEYGVFRDVLAALARRDGNEGS